MGGSFSSTQCVAGLVLSVVVPSPFKYKSWFAALVFSPNPVSLGVSNVEPPEVSSSVNVNTSTKSSIIFFAAPSFA